MRLIRPLFRLLFRLLFLAAFVLPVFFSPAAALDGEADASLVIATGTGEHAFTIEIADDAGEQAKGLMFREEMAANHGMLFDFGEARPVTMWMKNTPMSLDMVWIREDGTVAGVSERTTPFSEDVIPSPEPVPYVLEIRAGVARMIGLKPGDRVALPGK
jgi:uncharacterized membrane protein (UPF0127 family)